MSNPATLANRALDQIGRSDLAIGDIEEGSEGARVLLRVYDPSLRQLLRTAHWTFARKVASLVMLADASGQTDGVGTDVIQPWIYEYSVPQDMLKARFLPFNYLNVGTATPAGNISLPDVPQTSVSQPPLGPGMRLIPAPFLISMDTNYPVDVTSNWQDDGSGASPGGRLVVLTNVNAAQLVYTAYMPFPSLWDPLFEQALVDLMVSRIAVPLSRDPRFGLQLQGQAIQSVKTAIGNARIVSSQESSFPQTTDHTPDFLRIRNRGAGWSAGGPASGFGPGVLNYGWDSLSFSDGSVY